MLCWAMAAVLQAGPPARSAALARREPASPQTWGSLHTGITCASLGCTSLTCNNDGNCPYAGTDPDDHACVGATPAGGQAGAGAAGWWRQRRRKRRRESRSPRAHEHDGSALDIHAYTGSRGLASVAGKGHARVRHHPRCRAACSARAERAGWGLPAQATVLGRAAHLPPGADQQVYRRWRLPAGPTPRGPLAADSPRRRLHEP